MGEIMESRELEKRSPNSVYKPIQIMIYVCVKQTQRGAAKATLKRTNL